DTDAVNVAQLNNAIGDIGGDIALAVKYDDSNKQSMTLAGANGTTINNLASGNLAAGSMQAVNGGQLYNLGDQMAQMLGGGATMGANGLIGPVFNIQGNGYYNVGDAFSAVDGQIGQLDQRLDNLENGASPPTQETPPSTKPAAPPLTGEDNNGVAPVEGAGNNAGDGTALAKQEQIDEAKAYADAGNQKAEENANSYTDRQVADKVSQSDFSTFKSDVDQRFDMTHKKISRVGAMAAAMAGMAGAISAAPNNPNRINAALGAYGGQTALSLGFAKRIGDNAAVLIGGSVATGGESSGTVAGSWGW
ncbi:MAG: YadA-like family protein, partial [Glaciimonas sp.]|nr:YadA-like family protein [Glaciimonas sp.]